MQAANVPPRFSAYFANAAGVSYVRQVPDAPPVEVGAASMQTGFPPINFTPIASGGIPPFGQDFNGLLRQITQWNQWQAAGGPVAYNAAFQTAIGGYPAGAVVTSATTLGRFWLCLTDNNTTNPDTGGANWREFAPGVGGQSLYGVAGGTANVLTLTTTPVISAYTTGTFLYPRAALANTATTVTLNWNGLGAKSVKLPDNSDPAIGQVTAGAVLALVYDGTNLIWTNAPALASTPLGAAIAAGSANALTATIAGYQAPSYGTFLKIEASATNSAAVTLAVNGGSAVAITHYDGSAVTAGEIISGVILELLWDGAVWVWLNGPWVETAPVGTNTKRAASTAFVRAEIANSSAFQYFNTTSASPFARFTFNYVDTSGGAVSKPLPPTPASGDTLTFTDIAKIWDTNNFTLQRNGQTIQGLAEDLVCNVANLQFSIYFNGTTWVLF